MKQHFDDLWAIAEKRSSRFRQSKEELIHIFELMKDCSSYLEVGSWQGASLYVLGNSMREITYIDWEQCGHPYNTDYGHLLQRVADDLADNGVAITGIKGDSNDYETYAKVKDKTFDAVMIDAGHEFHNVLTDIFYYAPLAKKYVFIHDIYMSETATVWKWICDKKIYGNPYEISHEKDRYGYGILRR